MRRTVLVVVAAATVTAYAVAAWMHVEHGSGSVFWWAVAVGTAGMITALVVSPRLDTRVAVGVVLVAGALCRVVLLPTMPDLSNDLYRYLWDGRVQQEGINPYRHPPAAPELELLRDEDVYPRINRKAVPTIYPGGAQLLFHGAREVGIAQPWTFKAMLLGIEALAVGLMLRVSRRLRRDPGLLALYVWNPVVVLGIAHSGHIDAVVVLAVAAAAYAWTRGRDWTVGVALGLGAAVKLFPLLLLPAFLRRRDDGGGAWAWRTAVATLAVPVLAYLPYLGVGRDVLGFLTTDGYLQQEGYVSGSRFVLAQMVGLGFAAVVVAGAAVAAWALWSRRPAPAKAAALFGAALLLASPYPWYGIPLVALSAMAGPGLGEGRRWTEFLWPLLVVGLGVAYVSFFHGIGVPPRLQRQVLLPTVLVAVLVAVARPWWQRRRGPVEEPSHEAELVAS